MQQDNKEMRSLSSRVGYVHLSYSSFNKQIIHTIFGSVYIHTKEKQIWKYYVKLNENCQPTIFVNIHVEIAAARHFVKIFTLSFNFYRYFSTTLFRNRVKKIGKKLIFKLDDLILILICRPS